MPSARSLRLFGIPAQLPTFGELTASSLLALGLWLAACGLLFRLGQTPERFDAGALLLLLEWTCVSIRAGIQPRLGARHVAVNLGGCAALLGVYASACSVLA